MPKLTIETLKQKRNDARKEIYLRDGEFRGRITVHLGTCGIAAGARDVMAAILDGLEKGDIRDVMLTRTGCAGLCSREPMITVELRDSAPVKYGDLTPQKVLTILTDHIVGGRLVTACAIGLGSERGG